MSTPPDRPDVTDLPAGSGLGRTSFELPGVPGSPGPLADPGTVTGGPIDDPALADRNNPRWSEGATGSDGAGSGDASDSGSSPSVAPRSAGALDEETGTPQDQAAQPLEGLLETGTDNIRHGRGDVQSNPALAEGGDNG